MPTPATTVTLTGTGTPHPCPGRAGPGALVRFGEIALQFDAGRGSVLRLVEAGIEPHAISALFITHIHSDHLVDLADVVLTRWLQGRSHTALPIVAPAGAATEFANRVLEPWADDIAVRIAHVQHGAPTIDVRAFVPTSEPATVWTSDDGAVTVDAIAVHHEPVVDAVAYRVTTPTGIVVISGDTVVCAEVERLSNGADVLVHEACRTTALRDLIAGTRLEAIFGYHADTVPLGGLAERAGVAHVLLTHLIPPPGTEAAEAEFDADLRLGGYTGRVSVGRDLMTVTARDADPV
ncbi:MAG: Hydrolase [Ilumatobacteraceae bacterium]|nr:Hydrolase [Ilumatobacteraceae bacterium]